MKKDNLVIAKKNFKSRLIVGTGKYKSMLECAKAIKISGAGGGGFMMVYVDPSHRLATSNFLKKYDGRVYNFHFTLEGAIAWKV